MGGPSPADLIRATCEGIGYAARHCLEAGELDEILMFVAPVLLVAGGSGIVPLMAMIRARGAVRGRQPFRLIYSVRTPADVLYADELARRVAQRGLAGQQRSGGAFFAVWRQRLAKGKKLVG